MPRFRMPRFCRQGKIHHALIFDQKSRNNPLLSTEERMAIFVTEQVDLQVTDSAGDDTNDRKMSKPQEERSNVYTKGDQLAENKAKKQKVVWDEGELRWKKKRTLGDDESEEEGCRDSKQEEKCCV